ncbi:MAG: hypothetical protein IJV22_01140 [Bacteroidales bacterium]|nr:hypothetical protein [Bacteroidales bacterium]
MEDNYDDIINLPRHRSAKHPPMSLMTRAAQYSSFDALGDMEAFVEATFELQSTTSDDDANSSPYLAEQREFFV